MSQKQTKYAKIKCVIMNFTNFMLCQHLVKVGLIYFLREPFEDMAQHYVRQHYKVLGKSSLKDLWLGCKYCLGMGMGQ